MKNYRKVSMIWVYLNSLLLLTIKFIVCEEDVLSDAAEEKAAQDANVHTPLHVVV